MASCAIEYLYFFIRYTLKCFRQFLNKNMCYDWLNSICTRDAQSLYADPCDQGAQSFIG